jgi:3',5'-cyclic AMP phosphodiesterase CpdA
MKIHIISDIHLEFGKFRHSPPESDVVVLSGDIAVGLAGIEWAQKTFDCPVVYVAGNHEFYSNRVLHEHYDKMRQKAAGTNVRFLQNEAAEIDGVRFLGCTLWTDFDLYGNSPVALVVAQQKVNDFQQVKLGYRKPFTSSDALVEHMVSRQFMRDEFEKGFPGKTVVCTHHAPSELSVHERYQNDKLTPAYASRLENFILTHDPVLWTHGHLHNSVDYEIGDTRVVCNPRGYVGHELNSDFDPELVIEI